MRTTIRLGDALLERAKKEAARRGVTLTALIEHGLRLAMSRPLKAGDRARVVLPVSRNRGGMLPGVSLDDASALVDLMEAGAERHR